MSIYDVTTKQIRKLVHKFLTSHITTNFFDKFSLLVVEVAYKWFQQNNHLSETQLKVILLGLPFSCAMDWDKMIGNNQISY